MDPHRFGKLTGSDVSLDGPCTALLAMQSDHRINASGFCSSLGD
jgi:hypothetical protein